MENNNAPIESTNTNPLFIPRGYWGKGATIEMAQLAKAEFEGVEMYPEQPPVSAAELKEILRELAPRVAVAANECEMSPIEIEVYSKWGDISKETVVNAPPLLVHFAFLALSFIEAEADQPLPALASAGALSPAGAPGGFNADVEAIEPEGWEDAAKALKACSDLAEASAGGRQFDFISDLNETQETFSHLRKGLGAMLWLFEEYRENATERLEELIKDAKGFGEILGAPVPETVATESDPSGPGEPPAPPIEAGEGEHEDGPNWEEVAKAFDELSSFAKYAATGDEACMTINFDEAAPLHRALVLVRKALPDLEEMFLEKVEEEIELARIKVRDYGLLKELDNPDFEAIDQSPIA